MSLAPSLASPPAVLRLGWMQEHQLSLRLALGGEQGQAWRQPLLGPLKLSLQPWHHPFAQSCTCAQETSPQGTDVCALGSPSRKGGGSKPGRGGSCHCWNRDRPGTPSWHVPARPHKEPYQPPLGPQGLETALVTRGPACHLPCHLLTPPPLLPSGPSTLPKPTHFLLPPPYSLGFSLPQCLLALSPPGLLPLRTATTHQKAGGGALTGRGHGFDFKLASVLALCVKKKFFLIEVSLLRGSSSKVFFI